jgi:uncharacterized membrane protein YtjA (UPF0391 family)
MAVAVIGGQRRIGFGQVALIPRRRTMLYWAAVFFIIALVAGLFGFWGLAAGAAGVAKILFFVFLVLAVIALLFRGRAPI